MPHFTKRDRRPSLTYIELVHGLLYEIADIGAVQYLNDDDGIRFLSLEGKGEIRMSVEEINLRDVRGMP